MSRPGVKPRATKSFIWCSEVAQEKQQLQRLQTDVTVHTTGKNEEHETRSKLKITVFNKSKRARQGNADTDKNTGSNE